jgi:hypothetical protein
MGRNKVPLTNVLHGRVGAWIFGCLVSSSSCSAGDRLMFDRSRIYDILSKTQASPRSGGSAWRPGIPKAEARPDQIIELPSGLGNHWTESPWKFDPEEFHRRPDRRRADNSGRPHSSRSSRGRSRAGETRRGTGKGDPRSDPSPRSASGSGGVSPGPSRPWGIRWPPSRPSAGGIAPRFRRQPLDRRDGPRGQLRDTRSSCTPQLTGPGGAGGLATNC